MITPQEAKDASIGYLSSHGIPYIDHLPLIDTYDELAPQDSVSVARRAIILCHVLGIGFGGSAQRSRDTIHSFGFDPHLSGVERDWLSRETHTDQEHIEAEWLVECMQAFAWCFRLADLDPFTHCDDDLASQFPAPFTDPSSFVSTSELRPFEEIYLQADLHYRLHWAAKRKRYEGVEAGLSESIIRERRRALDWVIGVEADWDQIPMDT